MTSLTAGNTEAEALQTNTTMSSSSADEPNQKKRSSSIIRLSMLKHNQADTGLGDKSKVRPDEGLFPDSDEEILNWGILDVLSFIPL